MRKGTGPRRGKLIVSSMACRHATRAVGCPRPMRPRAVRTGARNCLHLYGLKCGKDVRAKIGNCGKVWNVKCVDKNAKDVAALFFRTMRMQVDTKRRSLLPLHSCILSGTLLITPSNSAAFTSRRRINDGYSGWWRMMSCRATITSRRKRQRQS